MAELTQLFFFRNPNHFLMLIKHICKISNGQVWLDDNILHEDRQETFQSFIHEVYRSQKIAYPKFFKMDPLSKFAIVGSSIIFDNLDGDIERDTALVFANRSSCIDIDKKHLDTITHIDNYYPSPANFVYTLPNISLGEVSIKYNLKTENAFFVFEEFNKPFLFAYSETLLYQNKATMVLCAWIEVNNDAYEGIFFLVSKEGSEKNLTTQLKNFIIP